MRVLSSQKLFFLKVVALLSIIRWYAIGIVAFAQLLVSIFVINNRNNWKMVVTDPNLWIIMVCTMLTIAAGFAINNFYDSDRDLVNRPQQTLFERIVSKRFIFRFYFGTNALVFALAFLISWRALVFFGVYAVGLWFYSHKIKKATFFGNLAAVILSIAPFFAIFVYYRYFSWPIFFYVAFIMFLILIRDIIKDLQTQKGDVLYDYHTLPAVYGVEKTKTLIILLTVFSYAPAFVSYSLFPNNMQLYLTICMILITLVNVAIFQASKPKHYFILNQLYKVLIGVSMIMIVFL
ncbi:MAG: geranylgeranylglycerol-phosphate geranylgeranyltransferase [Schleiferiaceae bacterium]|jgi:4-hydroxybenzoate polyprenyltransferase|nr:geranylgeranylglycerol-phosphate geranylgeranyltransferase [Schleiferiaceae bacterium]